MSLLAAVLAIQSGPAVDVEAGFGGRFFQDAWSRVTVVVQNPGEEIEGRLRVRLLMGDRAEQELRQPVVLPTRSRKRFTWDVWVSVPATEVAAELVDAKDRLLAARTVPVRVLLPGLRQIVQVGGRFPGLESGSQVLVTGTRTGQTVGEERVTAVVKPEILASAGIPLLGADVLAFPEPVVLEPEQEEAVARWVEGGGVLLWSAGRASAALQRPFWKEHCPAVLRSYVAVDDEGLRATMIEAEPKPGGLVVATLAGRPAVVRAAKGLGGIVFVATDPARIDGRPRFAPEILLPEEALPAKLLPAPATKLKVEKDLGVRVWDADRLTTSWFPNPWRAGPRNRSVALLWMTLYVVLLGPGSYVFLRGRRRLGAPIFVVLTAAGVYFTVSWGRLSEKEAVLVHRVIADPHRIQTWTRGTWGAGAQPLAEIAGAIAPLPHGEELAFTQESTGSLRIAVPPMATTRFRSARTALPGELGIDARWIDRGTIEIRSSGRLSLFDVQLAAGGRVWDLPDAAAGDRRFALEDLPSRTFEQWTAETARIERAGARGTRWWTAGRWHPGAGNAGARAFTFAEALGRDVRQDWDLVLLRGVDLSRALMGGRAVLLASFREDVSGLRVDPPVRTEVEGLLRLVVDEERR